MASEAKDHKAMLAIFGLPHKDKPEEDGAPDGEDGEDGEFKDAWHEYKKALDDGDDDAACQAMMAMIDIRVHAGGEPDGDEGAGGGKY